MQLRDPEKSGSQLSSCRNIPEECTIYAQLVNMGSQRHLEISRLSMPVMPQSTDLLVAMTKRTFQYLVDNMTGLAFHHVPRHETSRLAVFLNVYLSVCSPYCWLCTFLSHCVSTIHIILSTIFSRLCILMHYVISFALFSNPLSPLSAHMSVLTDSLGPSRHDV